MYLSKRVVIAMAVVVVAGTVAGPLAYATVVVQYGFEGNLLDTAPGGGTTDSLSATAASGAVSVSYAPGVVGQAAFVSRAPGEATVLQAADSGDLDLGATWTVEAFVMPDAANTGEWDRFATKWFGPTNDWHWAFRYANNGQDLFLNGHQVINGSGTGTVPHNVWSHVAMTGSPADGIKLWQNGSVVATAAHEAVAAGTAPFRIGNMDASGGGAPLQFSGLVDEFLVHSGVAQDQAYMQARAGLIPPQPVPSQGLVNYYDFQGNSDDTAGLYTVRGGVQDDHLTLVGSGTYVPGKVGRAIDLNGGYLAAPNLPIDDIGLPPTFTVEAWINPDDPSKAWNRLVLNWGNAERGYHFGLRGNDVNLFLSATGSDQHEVATGGDVLAGAWQHIAATCDGATVRLYLDGVEVDTGLLPAGAPYATVSEALGIADSGGAPSSGSRFYGLLDELAMWNVALSPDAIREHYERGAAGYGLVLVPEPTTFSLCVAGGLLALLRRRRRAQAKT